MPYLLTLDLHQYTDVIYIPQTGLRFPDKEKKIAQKRRDQMDII